MEIMPLSQGEIDGVREDFLTVALEQPSRLESAAGTTTRNEYAQRICRGGLPIAVAASGRARVGTVVGNAWWRRARVALPVTLKAGLAALKGR